MKSILCFLYSLIPLFSFSQVFIDPALNKYKESENIKIVIVLKQKADLSFANQLDSKEAKASYVYNTLRNTSENSQSNILKFLKANNVEHRSFYIVNMVSAKADKNIIFQLSKFSEVAEILEDGKFQMQETIREDPESSRVTEWGINMIKAPDVWTMGYKGQGIIIGGQDTGYDWDHPALKNKYKGWNGSTANHDYHWHDAIHNAGTSNVCGSDSPEPCDDDTHGTHTMGTMVGDDGLGNQIGVAPDAKWIGCRNMDQGNGTLTTYVECFEWFLAPYPVTGTSANGDVTKAPHVINNSWGCPPSEGCNSTNFATMEAAISALKASGVVVVVSAGNSGPNCSTVNDPPAIFESSFSVGSTTSTDNISGFSSRGPVTVDGSNRLKPNVAAPGSNVRSCIPGTGYGSKSGTSMAGPHVAGAVALLLSANEELKGQVNWIEDIIEKTADPKTGVTCGSTPGANIPNQTFGWGRINVYNMIRNASIPFIKVDQFGYKTNDQKITVLSDPQTGINANASYTPSSSVSLRRVSDGVAVFTAAPTVWNAGATHSQSGDKAWWFDFSTYKTPGTYYISDGVYRSENFVINDDVYNDVLKTTFKSFYYQRCGMAKSSPFASTGFTDVICHTQDANCRSISAPSNTSLYKNLSGGWHDAGDYNKYINFTYSTLIDLLNAYEYHPEAWNDKMDIPESNNGIPDLLDEIKYELDWMIKMQNADGGINCVVGVQNFASSSPPSADAAIRYYGPATTSASISTAAVFAYAATQFKKIDNPTAKAYSNVLRANAIKAWNWALANPSITYNNSGVIAAGEQEVSTDERNFRKLGAAIYLYALTDSATFKTYVENNYTSAHLLAWQFVYPFENPMQLSLLYYASLSNVTTAVANAIKNAYKGSIENTIDNLPAFTNKTDAYRAFLKDLNHTWGSNGTKANMGNLFIAYHHYNLDTSKNTNIYNAASGFLHYLHGVNPLGRIYLTNMSSIGGEHSCRSLYHGWFTNGSSLWDDTRSSTYGPVPGLLLGGPNPTWSLDACCSTNTCGTSNALCINQLPPAGQPILKSFKEWNTSWPQNSWSITENSIYTEASYLALLASKVTLADTILNPNITTNFSNADLVIQGAGNAVVLTSPNGSKYKLVISNTGALTASIYTVQGSNDTELTNSSLVVTKPLSGIIFKSPDGNYWKLSMANNGAILKNSTSSLPNIRSNQSAGDIIVNTPNKGMLLKDLNGKCYLITVNNSGEIVSRAAKCVD